MMRTIWFHLRGQFKDKACFSSERFHQTDVLVCFVVIVIGCTASFKMPHLIKVIHPVRPARSAVITGRARPRLLPLELPSREA